MGVNEDDEADDSLNKELNDMLSSIAKHRTLFPGPDTEKEYEMGVYSGYMNAKVYINQFFARRKRARHGE